jgi:hypothetical protein
MVNDIIITTTTTVVIFDWILFSPRVVGMMVARNLANPIPNTSKYYLTNISLTLVEYLKLT